MDFTEIFCYVDDFFQELDKHTNSITNHNNKSGPKSRLNRSEVMSLSNKKGPVNCTKKGPLYVKIFMSNDLQIYSY
ncbi:hypothetical protein [Rickettsia endosymbiont of Nabis limbatus]|uniref:hypothetical protein n=1 Tax=Rickettsia endosymbiont of Nabis limbatus TaxID=3066268 RepID=UPI003AF3FAF1